MLERNLRRLSSDLGRIEIRRRGGVFIVTGGEPQATLVERCLALPGVSVVQPGLRCERDPSAAADAAVELLRGRPGRTFAVRTRRRDKRYPLRSMELSRVIGDAVRVRLGLGVDLSEPDLELHIEVDHKEMLVSCERLRGAGGLPVGSSGRALVLLGRARLAGGGLPDDEAGPALRLPALLRPSLHRPRVDLQGLRARRPARPLPGRLAHVRRLVRPSSETARDGRRGRLQVLSQRRLMVKVASELARRDGSEALVTGDSLGQVASQTLHNLAVVEEAAELPLMRPLIDRDKQEIVEIAKQLGTYDISILPDEDCCQLFSSRLAVTRGQSDALRQIERTADIEDMVDGLVESAQLYLPRLEEERPALTPA